MRSRALPWLAATLFYAALTIVLTWPLAAQLSSVLPHDLGDPLLNTWILWWNAHAVPLTARWWNAPMFWPAQGALGLSEHLLGVSLFATPMQWIGAGPVTAYNVAFLLSFPLSALAAHALGYTLTGRHDAALVAGLALGFNPYRIAQAPHLQVLTAYGMPAALFALHHYVRRRDGRWLWLFGAAWLQLALSNGYYLLFFPVLLLLWIAWFTIGVDRRASIAITGAWLLATLPALPFVLKYREIHTAFNLHRRLDEIQEFSADAAGLFDASPLMTFWGRLSIFHRPEGELFPGLTIGLLVAAGVAAWIWTTPRPARMPRMAAAFLALSAVCIAVALSAIALGPWSIGVAGVKLLSVAVPSKPFSLGLLFLALAVATEPRVTRAASTRSPLLFYLAAAAMMYLMSFGPHPRLFGRTFVYQPPYRWLMAIPGFDTFRVPARFAMLAIVCLSAAAALAFARLTAAFDRRTRAIAATAVVAALLADSWITVMPLVPVPPRLRAAESLPPGTAAVLEIPMGDTLRDTAAMYRGMFYGRPVVNGYSGFIPPAYDVLHLALEVGDLDVIDDLASSGPLAVIVDAAHDRAERWLKPLAERPGVVALDSESARRMFWIPATSGSRSVEPHGRRLPIQSVSANTFPMDARRVIDGDLVSRWETRGAQRGTEEVTLDLGSIQMVDGVTLWLGPYSVDYPRLLEIGSSEDGRDWSARWSGRTAALAMTAARLHPRDMPLSFSFAPVRARFIRLRELAADPLYHWSIGEVAVFGR